MNTEMNTKNHKLLTCDMVAPDSTVFCWLSWMEDLEQAEGDEILTSTQTILNRNTQLTDEDSDNYNKAFKPIPTTTAGDEIKLINEQGVTAWSNKTKEKKDTDQLYLPTLVADITEIETDTEEDYWENVSLIVTQDIQIETDDGQNPAEPTLGNLPTNNPNEVDYDNLDQNINLANQ